LCKRNSREVGAPPDSMRILIASGTWYPERNGVARVATEVGRGLARRGHEVTALVPRATGLPREDFDGSLRVLRVIERGLLPLTIKDVFETKRHSRSLGAFDLLLAHGAMTAVGLSSADSAAPLVLVYHASLPRELRFMRSRLPWGHERVVAYLNGPLTGMLDRVALRRSARILILSEYTRSLLLSDHLDQSHKIRAVSGGVETAAFRPRDGMAGARRRLGVRAGRRLLVTVRRAEPRMGIEQLLGAVRLMADDDVDLAVVGGGLLTDELRRLASELGIERRVQFVGKVREEELHDWYRAADLFVLPTVAYEGFGMVTVEALASGTPVVGTSAGATPELLEPLDPRLVTEGSDPHSLAAAIQEALAFVDNDFRARCRRYAEERFDWDRIMPGWEEALASVASGQNRSWAGQMRSPNGYPQ
jgi:glycosyltransferase involved in cell wall biosynthesis